RLACTTNDATFLYYMQTSVAGDRTTYYLATVTANGTINDIFNDDQPFEFDATRYLNDIVVVIANRAKLRVYYSNTGSPFASLNGLNLQAEYAIPTNSNTISANSRFITTSSGLSVDLERNVTSHFNNVCHDTIWQQLNHALLYCPDNDKLLIHDFDGTNPVTVRMPDGVTMPAPTDSLTNGDFPTTFQPAAIINRRTLYYWTISHENDALQLQLRQLRL
ncbi:hypothetical protein FWG76_01675, partial [Candidatus Saccharibacteria bacterium]|nr:hypothetical protein [Candidatus Saccharibacteria bacterium]